MTIGMHEKQGRTGGSKITLSGSILGLSLEVEELVTKYDYPYSKTWKTVGSPHLLVMGSYRMGFCCLPGKTGRNCASLSTMRHPAKALPACWAACSASRTHGDVPAAWRATPRCTFIRDGAIREAFASSNQP